MELKEMIKVMQHYENGGEIKFKRKDINITTWTDAEFPNWNWNDFDYRIKEERQKVTIEKWLLKDNNGDFFIREGDKNHIVYAFRNKVKLLESYQIEL